ncbi:MAG: hypothetical protein QME66_01760 [Candidatus Eisenbacteria bacterium]|nr:hypothetical protein [Candidatus Eisenbacteria bacterium]
MGRASLLVVMGFLVVFGTLKSSINKTVQSLTRNLVSSFEDYSARDAAGSSVLIALRKISKDNDLRGTITLPPFSGASATVTVVDSTTDSTLARNEVRLLATASVGSTSRKVKVLAKRESLVPQDTEAAIGLKGAVTSVDFLGAAFLIDGHDWLPGGPLASPADSVPGVSASSAADSTALVAGLGPSWNQVQGAGPEPSISTLKGTYDFNRMFQGFRSVATRILSVRTTIGGGQVWGTRAQPEVTIISGIVKVAGATSGVGVLAVDGSLTVTGNFYWEGFILVKSAGSIELQGNSTIYGGLLCESGPAGFGFRSQGSMSLYYSSSSLETARSKLDINYFKPYAWYE